MKQNKVRETLIFPHSAFICEHKWKKNKAVNSFIE